MQLKWSNPFRIPRHAVSAPALLASSGDAPCLLRTALLRVFQFHVGRATAVPCDRASSLFSPVHGSSCALQASFTVWRSETEFVRLVGVMTTLAPVMTRAVPVTVSHLPVDMQPPTLRTGTIAAASRVVHTWQLQAVFPAPGHGRRSWGSALSACSDALGCDDRRRSCAGTRRGALGLVCFCRARVWTVADVPAAVAPGLALGVATVDAHQLAGRMYRSWRERRVPSRRCWLVVRRRWALIM